MAPLGHSTHFGKLWTCLVIPLSCEGFGDPTFSRGSSCLSDCPSPQPLLLLLIFNAGASVDADLNPSSCLGSLARGGAQLHSHDTQIHPRPPHTARSPSKCPLSS